MKIEFKKISTFNRGILLNLLKDAYSFDKKYEDRDSQQWQAFDDFFFDNISIADKYGFITTLNDEPIGFVSWDPRKRPKYVEIGHNCIATKYKGNGYGNMQMSEAVSRIKKYDSLEKIIVTTDEALISAQKMYENAGFILKDKRQNNDRYNDNIDYEIKLERNNNMEKSKVYFTKNITSESLIKLYDVLKRELKGNVAVKVSTGEPGGHNFLNPMLIKPLVDKLNGTIVECCTAYRGKRFEVSDHWKAINDHGFKNIAPCDIMDEDGEIEIPVTGGTHLKGINIVGSHIKNYDSMLMLSHFKGHAMGGFGGALKNMSIGVSSKNGKAWIHSVGRTKDPDEAWNYTEDQDGFLESMAEADEAVVSYFKPKNMVYINIANNLSIDCDCDSNPSDPKMEDIGIFASLDPVALDKCCYDTVMNSNDEGKSDLVNRMLEKHSVHIIEEAEKLQVGTSNYEVVNIDDDRS